MARPRGLGPRQHKHRRCAGVHAWCRGQVGEAGRCGCLAKPAPGRIGDGPAAAKPAGGGARYAGTLRRRCVWADKGVERHGARGGNGHQDDIGAPWRDGVQAATGVEPAVPVKELRELLGARLVAYLGGGAGDPGGAALSPRHSTRRYRRGAVPVAGGLEGCGPAG